MTLINVNIIRRIARLEHANNILVEIIKNTNEIENSTSMKKLEQFTKINEITKWLSEYGLDKSKIVDVDNLVGMDYVEYRSII